MTRLSADFEHQYRRTLVQQLDRLEMFGLRLAGAGTRTVGLLSTYVPLTATPEGAETACPIEDAIAHSHRVVIRGEAGLGKTTLMQFLAVQGARKVFAGSLEHWSNLVPFYIRLRDLVHAQTHFPRPEQFLTGAVGNLQALMPAGWVQNAFASGALVLIDGVDELPAQSRSQFFEWIQDLIATFVDSVFIVSSRPAALEAQQPVHLAPALAAIGFVGVTLAPMTLSDSQAWRTYRFPRAS